MSFSQATYTGDGTTTEFPVPFEYINPAYIKCYVDGVSTPYTMLNVGIITLDTAPADGAVVIVKRETPVDNRLVDFKDTSILTERLLDLSALQVFHIAQEAYDALTSAIHPDLSGTFDAQGSRITNVGDPVNATDAVNKAYYDNDLKPKLETYRDEAFNWAEADEDTSVTDSAGRTGYSAFHHASKAAYSASEASTSASAATTSASEAAASASDASTSASEASTSASAAATSASEASTSASEAAASASDASTSASDASTSASEASTSASAATTSASAATTSASEASTSASEAAASASDASTSASDASTFENKAQQWANENEDVEVETGLFSSYHWTQKAEDERLGAESAKGDAETYRDEAFNWAEAGEDVSVTDSAGNTGNSAYHHRMKAEQAEIGAQAARDEAEAALGDADTVDGHHASDFVLAANASSGVPSGCILMWSGTTSDIPSGWVLCNGNNGTPNLQDRFIVGAGSSYSSGATGGADSVTLTEAQMPSHNHYFSDTTSTDGSHNHSITSFEFTGYGDGAYERGRSGDESSYTTSSSGNHNHNVSGNTNTTGSDSSHENRPPYYALCFIMKL